MLKQQFLVLFLMALQLINAQTVVVSVKDTNEPISGVAIYNTEKTKSVVTDLDGKALLDKFSANELLILQHLSHETLTIVKSKVGAIIYLQPHSQDLEQVVISASKFEQKQKDVPQKIISLKDFKIYILLILI